MTTWENEVYIAESIVDRIVETNSFNNICINWDQFKKMKKKISTIRKSNAIS